MLSFVQNRVIAPKLKLILVHDDQCYEGTFPYLTLFGDSRGFCSGSSNWNKSRNS